MKQTAEEQFDLVYRYIVNDTQWLRPESVRILERALSEVRREITRQYDLSNKRD